MLLASTRAIPFGMPLPKAPLPAPGLVGAPKESSWVPAELKTWMRELPPSVT